MWLGFPSEFVEGPRNVCGDEEWVKGDGLIGPKKIRFSRVCAGIAILIWVTFPSRDLIRALTFVVSLIEHENLGC